MITTQTVQPNTSKPQSASNLVRFEHINLSTRNMEAMRHFYQIIFPDWYVRAEGEGWMHLGSDRFYISLFEEPDAPERTHVPYNSIGYNHIGFAIADAVAMQNILDANAIKYEVVYDAPETKSRIYLFDPDGNELEFVDYVDSYPLK